MRSTRARPTATTTRHPIGTTTTGSVWRALVFAGAPESGGAPHCRSERTSPTRVRLDAAGQRSERPVRRCGQSLCGPFNHRIFVQFSWADTPCDDARSLSPSIGEVATAGSSSGGMSTTRFPSQEAAGTPRARWMASARRTATRDAATTALIDGIDVSGSGSPLVFVPGDLGYIRVSGLKFGALHSKGTQDLRSREPVRGTS